MKYALLYQRLNVATLEQETVVEYYAEGMLTAEQHETIAAPRDKAERTMIMRGWQYASSAGQSILLKREAE